MTEQTIKLRMPEYRNIKDAKTTLKKNQCWRCGQIVKVKHKREDCLKYIRSLSQ